MSWRSAKFISFFFILLAIEIAQGADWAKNFGAWNRATVGGYSTAVDASGNSYIAGIFDGTTLVLGGVTLTKIGNQDGFIAKMDSSGTLLWAKNFGGSGSNVYSESVTVDSSGNVYVSGQFINTNLTTPALTLIGSRTAYVIKYNSSGTISWSKNFGGVSAWAYGLSLAIDSSGFVFLGGSVHSGNLTTPALTLISNNDAFVIKMNLSTGAVVWSRNFGGSGAVTTGRGIAVDSSGNSYLIGQLTTSNMTTPALTKIGTSDAYVIKLDSSGTTTWSKNFGGSGATVVGSGIDVDSSGNVYITGDFMGSNLTTPVLAKIGSSDTFAIKLDSSGTTTWSKNFGGSSAFAYGQDIAVDSSGNVYVNGNFNSANLTTPALTRIGNSDAFAIKLDSSGTTTWSKNFGGSSAIVYGQDIAFDSTGSVFITGYFQTTSLTTPALPLVGTTDAFNIKLDSSGTTTWSNSFNTLKADGAITINSIARDPSNGNIYIAGSFNGSYAFFGGVTLTLRGSQDAFVAKLDKEGTPIWAMNYGGFSSNCVAYGVAVDSAENIYLSGIFSAASLTTPALSKIGTQDAFVFKLDSSGAMTWSKNFGGTGASVIGASIAIGSGGNVHLGASFSGANLTTPVLSKIGTQDAIVIKLDSSGTTTWSKNFGGSGASVVGSSVSVSSASDVYLSGAFYGGSLTTPIVSILGAQDAFAIKLDSSGTTTWSRNFGGPGATAKASGVAGSSNGNTYLGGTFSGANLTTPALTKIGTQDSFAFKLDSSGTTTWSKNFGGAGATTIGQSIAVDTNENSYLIGYFQSASLTTPALTLVGFNDGFAIKLNSSGTTTWSKNFGGAIAIGNSVAVDSTGNLLLGGVFAFGNLTTPALTKIGQTDALVIDYQLFNTACTGAGKVKYDTSNNLMVFCDGSSWQSMNNNSASACTGSTTGKLQYFPNGASSDFVWYGSSCRSSKSTTTFGACSVNGKWYWDAGNSTISACINGTWTSLKGW